MDVRQQLAALGFSLAGTIYPEDAGRRCRAHFERAVEGFIVYAHVVGNQVKKFGTTRPRLKARVHQNVSTINQVILLAEGRAHSNARWHHRPFDAFKRLAPEVIRANQSIEVWAIQSTALTYKALERDLNARYETIQNGWVSRLG